MAKAKSKSNGSAKNKGPRLGAVGKISNTDAKGRIVLGPRFANRMFRVSEQPNGDLLLEPVVAVHERDARIFQNPEVQALVQMGIKQSRKGKGKSLGTFVGHIDEEE